jgi:hypothetical protein
VLTALFYERFGWHARAEYDSFVHHYGFDLMSWPGYPVFADVRELMMTLWVGRQMSTSRSSAGCRLRRSGRLFLAVRRGGRRTLGLERGERANMPWPVVTSTRSEAWSSAML